MYSLVRPWLFKLDPETAHHFTLQLIHLGGFPPINFLLKAVYSAPGRPVEAFGLRFPNPIGLAAGYDKDGFAWRGLAALGFGHIEIGTVTPLPQPGNPKPRVFRLVEDQAVINRMGFPGKGSQIVAKRLRRSAASPREHPQKNGQVVVGVNLGKNRDTLLENAASDYIKLMRQFTPFADYLVINVSSPNTAGLRRLQGRKMLAGLLESIARERETIALGRGGSIPILVKLAPDLSDEELDDALEVILRTGMDGVIATNTTLRREGLQSRQGEQQGGLSGAPLRHQSMAVLIKIVKKLQGSLPVISVGGIMIPEDARARLDAGATLVQVFTGLVYSGPGLVKQILLSL